MNRPQNSIVEDPLPVPVAKKARLQEETASSSRGEGEQGVTPELSQTEANLEGVTRRCEVCEKDLPRSKYGKKQWNKAYGGWQCQPCVHSESQRVHRLSREAETQTAQADKRNRHEQKMSDQSAKQQQVEIEGGTTTTVFARERRCLGCKQVKLRSSYSGKQWKQLFRECINCVLKRQEQKNTQPGSTLNNTNSQVQEKVCSGCDLSKKSSDFSPKQWKHGHDADRWCKICWADEELAREDHRKAIAAYQTETGDDDKKRPSKKRCFACHEFKEATPANFSGKQQKKPYGICAPCVEILQAARRQKYSNTSSENVTKQCSVCQEPKGYGDFAREQWKGNNKTDRKCRLCAAVHVKEQDEHRRAERVHQKQQQSFGDGASATWTTTNQSPNTACTSSMPNTSATLAMRRCFQCKQFQEVEGFSGRQWTKTYATCKTCTVTNNTPSIAIDNTGGGATAGSSATN